MFSYNFSSSFINLNILYIFLSKSLATIFLALTLSETDKLPQNKS